MLNEFNQSTPADLLVEKWSPVLDHEALPGIGDAHKRRVTAILLENQVKAMQEEKATGAVGLFENTMGPIGMGGNFTTGQVGAAGNFAGYDPVMISLVRRAMPNVVAYDIAGVQPMTAPTGLIFAMRARYGNDSTSGYTLGTEALFDEPWAKFSGICGASGPGGQNYGALLTGSSAGVLSGILASSGATYISRVDPFTAFRGMLTSTAESLGATNTGADFREMAFSIERVAVQARSRALKAEYTTELAQDLRAVHGLDAEAELANILSVEIMNEINREILRAMYYVAKTGCVNDDLAGYSAGGNGGVYDLIQDSDGRWSAERYRGLMFQIEREANQIAKDTRRGKGNFIVCSADVASALAMGGFLNLSPALNVDLQVDDTGNVFAGVLNNKFKVYIDPFVANNVNFVTVGYKGTSPYDAGFFYCPYVPLQMVRAIGQDTFQPKIGFKTRYGLVANPFAGGRNSTFSGDNDGLQASTNAYYRLFAVKNLHGNTA